MKQKKDKIAIIVQRWHPSVTGGSEAHAWQYACFLKHRYAVELLTTTALDAVSWNDELPPGLTEEQGVKVRRFTIEAQRNNYWHGLHSRLISDVARLTTHGHRVLDHRDNWTVALQREFVAKQGPYAPTLWKYIESNHRNYTALIFVTYLYPTTYFGIEAAARHPNLLLVPTLHDEPAAYLSGYRRMARSVRSILWNTEVERRLAFGLWGPLDGEIVSMAIRSKITKKDTSQPRFLLYSGRIDHHKGCGELFDFFLEFKKRYPSELRLKLTGVRSMEVPDHPDIEFLGFVSEEEKTRLMAAATAFVMPSANESLSIVTLEAMAQETPILANARGRVIVEHLARSGGGLLYSSLESFIGTLSRLLTQESARQRMGSRGRAYVIENYDEPVVQERLFRAVEGGTASQGNGRGASKSQSGSIEFE